MCGIIGIIGPDDNKELLPNSAWTSYEVYRGLLTLQHRGQDAAGILSYDAHQQIFNSEKNLGLVSNVFNSKNLNALTGGIAIGHTRYVTIGENNQRDLQPLVIGFPFGIGMVHNGNVINYYSLADKIQKEYNVQLLTHNDLEALLILLCYHLLEDGKHFIESLAFDKVAMAVEKIFDTAVGAYSVIGVAAKEGMFGFRDPHGIRPLVLGRKPVYSQKGEKYSYILASETVAMNFLQYEFIRDILPGELIFISHFGKIKSKVIKTVRRHSSLCMFEWVYFSGAESSYSGKSVYRVRLNLGKTLAVKVKELINQKLINPDIVVPVPDTGRTAAISLAEELKIPYREGLIKNRYIYRSFILNSETKRKNAVELKLSPVRSEIEGKNILLVDDSIVRGTTSKQIITLLKKYGAKDITLSSTCPPIRYPCYYGIDFPSAQELIASNKTVDEIAQLVGAKSVIYLDEKDLIKAVGCEDLCMACLNKKYPTSLEGRECFTLKRELDRDLAKAV
mmetsp:Transcript_18841/g.8776  ORF Transcript_18841/g.8776 Transcript_18841/m.8776 type:complete len:506 (-) Transcript_18841:356-1873(-)